MVAIRERFYSLDVFRGMSVALMILVNNPGSWSHMYTPLGHAQWNGFTFADAVFPFFLFAVGNALSFVMPKMKAKGQGFFLKKVFRRFFLIFLIGFGLHWFPFITWEDNSLVFKEIENLRIMGVLQRIAVAYLVASLMLYYLSNKIVILISFLILLVYAIICHLAGAENMYNLFGAEFDKAILGSTHMWRGFWLNGEPQVFDPEGLASSFTPIVQVIFGYFAGVFIQKKGKNTAMMNQLLLFGVIGLVVGLLVNFYTPINKMIWTSSYVIFTTGLACVILSILIYFLELRSYKGFFSEFFNVFGKNPLFIFALSALLPKTLRIFRFKDGDTEKYTNVLSWFYQHICVPLFDKPKNSSLMYAICFITLMWFIAWYMDQKKIYIKV